MSTFPKKRIVAVLAVLFFAAFFAGAPPVHAKPGVERTTTQYPIRGEISDPCMAEPIAFSGLIEVTTRRMDKRNGGSLYHVTYDFSGLEAEGVFTGEPYAVSGKQMLKVNSNGKAQMAYRMKHRMHFTGESMEVRATTETKLIVNGRGDLVVEILASPLVIECL